MQWRFMIAALGLVLSACLHSEPAYIAPHDLVVPTGLDGRYWAIGHGGERIDAQIMAFARGADGLVRAQGLTEGEDTDVPLRFVRIAAPDLYLLVDDSEKDTSIYYLFRKRPNGIWDMFQPSLNKLSPFAAGQVAFLDGVAKRHGLSLDIGGDGSAITGPVTKGTIPALFRDPDFLAAIDTEPFATYLPLNAIAAQTAAVSPDEITTVTTSMMVFTGTFADWRGIVQPQGLDAAAYLDQYDGAGLADGITRFRLRADGRYDILEHGQAPRPVLASALVV